MWKELLAGGGRMGTGEERRGGQLDKEGKSGHGKREGKDRKKKKKRGKRRVEESERERA